jgi:hypothetical protein
VEVFNPPSTQENTSFRVESYVRTNGQVASVSWNKAPIRGLQPDFYYCQTVAGFLMWGALSDDRAVLSFTVAADPRQRSHSQVRVPWDSQPHFTVSDSRLPFLSPPMTHRATVEVFDPASHFNCHLISSRHRPHTQNTLRTLYTQKMCLHYPTTEVYGGPTWAPPTAFAVGSGGHDRLLQTKLQ